MSEMRTWTLKRFAPSIGGGRETRVRGAVLEDGEEVEAIELDPMLDLLEGVTKPRYRDEPVEWDLAAKHAAERFLRAHGRLSSGESA